MVFASCNFWELLTRQELAGCSSDLALHRHRANPPPSSDADAALSFFSEVTGIKLVQNKTHVPQGRYTLILKKALNIFRGYVFIHSVGPQVATTR